MPNNRKKIGDEIQRYHQAVAYLETLARLPCLPVRQAAGKAGLPHRRTRTESLRRFSFFLKLIGNPHKKLSYIHVAGTSGKGSVVVMTHEILSAAGKRTGLLVSPHTTTTIERIRINNHLMSPKEFSDIVEQLKPAIDRAHQSVYGQPSYFELITAIGLVYFVQKKCDYAVLEVGIGGRLDATNVIPTPKIAIINKIDFDHMDLLGTTLRQIAKQKAGIIKPRATVLLAGNNHPSAIKTIQRVSKHQRASLEIIKPTQQFQLAMSGPHQQQNAALAARAAELLNIAPPAITIGLRRAYLPCRFEVIQKKPLVIFDGAHNRSKLETVSRQLDDLTYHRLYLIIGLTHERQPQKLFKKLNQRAQQVICTRFTNNTFKRCYQPDALAKQVSNKKKKVFLDPFMALDYALAKATPDDLILITGSLYLTGQLRTYWRSEAQIVRERKS